MKSLFTAFALVMAAGTAAQADVATLSAQVQSGGAGGRGVSGDALIQDRAFHNKTAGIVYGAQVGVEILFVDVWVEHNQFVKPGGLLGTWTQLMLGFDMTRDLGKQKGGDLDARTGKVTGSHASGYMEFGLGVGFGAGTLKQVDPPLNNEQIDDKGFIGEARIGLGYRVNHLLSVGLDVPLLMGYMFKNGVANDVSNQYMSVSAAAMLNMRMTFALN